uniref:Putative ovule protein n=1 Tax=Solanum chacoense TaxID=4108 RepID=A0A0V0GYS8_SOLCH
MPLLQKQFLTARKTLYFLDKYVFMAAARNTTTNFVIIYKGWLSKLLINNHEIHCDFWLSNNFLVNRDKCQNTVL